MTVGLALSIEAVRDRRATVVRCESHGEQVEVSLDDPGYGRLLAAFFDTHDRCGHSIDLPQTWPAAERWAG